jgi:acyl-coenzyme A synthetase/AMP-(fatty) acid ligase
VGLTDDTRWVAGWLRTRDAATMDDAGRITIRGRLDSQVGIGGLKVDLTEVEQAIAALPGVAEVVVAFDGAIEAYLALTAPTSVADVEERLAERLAGYKRPRRWHLVERVPRTASGKLVRDLKALREAAEHAREIR